MSAEECACSAGHFERFALRPVGKTTVVALVFSKPIQEIAMNLRTPTRQLAIPALLALLASALGGCAAYPNPAAPANYGYTPQPAYSQPSYQSPPAYVQPAPAYGYQQAPAYGTQQAPVYGYQPAPAYAQPPAYATPSINPALAAAAGGLAGSVVGHGNGRVAAAAAGAGIGAIAASNCAGGPSATQALGAVAGGLIGSMVGHGNGRVAAAAVGSGLGAMVAGCN